MPKSKLTEADWDRIENLIATSIQTVVKPINDCLDVIEQDIKDIKECTTIKKELNK